MFFIIRLKIGLKFDPWGFKAVYMFKYGFDYE
jgi:hypothetical protein